MAPPTDPDEGLPDEFDPVWYLDANPDVAAAGLDPLAHFLSTGRAEGRTGVPLRAPDLDHRLWRGFEATAFPALCDLLDHGPAHERAFAGWALARWHVDRGETGAARRAIDVFLDNRDAGRHVLPHAGPWLLGVQLRLATGDPEAARATLRNAVELFGETPDLILAEMQILRAEEQDDADAAISELLSRLHAPRGFVPIGLAPGSAARFDRLCAAPRSQPEPGPEIESPPLVTVIVPAYEAEDVLGHALDGLSAQDWPALEILVVIDGSPDGSLQVARRHAEADPRIRILEMPGNVGAYPARNAGLAAAKGRFVTIHDADDWSHPAKIRLQVLPLLAEPDLVATVSHWVRAGSDLEMTRFRMEEGWVYRNVSSLMIRAELRDSLGYWDRARVNADTEYYYRIIAGFGAAAIREVAPGVPLSFGRTSPASLTMRSETHLRSQFTGLRRDYMEAAHDWHRRAGGIESLYLPERPAIRPFRIPAALAVGDPEPAPSDYDILKASVLMDRDWYHFAYPDVLRADIEPARHYLQRGAEEERDPGPNFSSSAYRHAYGLGPEAVPLLHWERVGRAEGLSPRPSMAGRLSPKPDAPVVLVFAHHAGTMLFGAERSFLDMLRRLAAKGMAPIVVLPALRNLEYIEKIAAFSTRIEVLPQLWRSGQREPHPATVALIEELIRRSGAREVHVNTLVLDAPLVAARAAGVRSVVHVRELPDDDATLCRNLEITPARLRADLLDQADGFVANSALVARWLDAGDRTTIQPNTVQPGLFALPFAPDPDQPELPLRVAMISSNIRKKGIADFLQVARLAQAAGSTARFLLIGPPTRDLHLLRPFPENVDYAGYVEGAEAAMEKADLVLSLSKFTESFGRTVLEAMAAGRPVICYDRGTPAELVESGVSGLVVAADDTRAAARAVLALDAARMALDQMSLAARQRARALVDAAG